MSQLGCINAVFGDEMQRGSSPSSAITRHVKKGRSRSAFSSSMECVTDRRWFAKLWKSSLRLQGHFRFQHLIRRSVPGVAVTLLTGTINLS